MIKLFKNKIILNKYFTLVFLFFIFFIPKASAQVNSGFVSGIWYSQTPFFAGETIRIYTAIQNQSGFDIAGKIRFYDGEEIIGESEFSSISGHLIEEWIDWNVSEGEHKIKAVIIDAIKSSPGANSEAITLSSNTSAIDTQFADIDTDTDRVGNEIDDDDDNDGLTDEQEIKFGTNPLLIDTDNDGLTDKEEFDTSQNNKTDNSAKSSNEKTTDKENDSVVQEIKTKSANVIKKGFNFLETKIDATVKKIILTLEKKVNNLEYEKLENSNEQMSKKKNFLKNFLSIMLSLTIWLFNNKWAMYATILFLLFIIWKIFRLFKKRQ